MNRQKVDMSVERRLVMGMIVSDEFLQQIQPIYDPELMEAPFSRRIAQWCLEYFEQYSKAPGRSIEDIFNSHVRKQDMQEDQSELISKFLGSLSNEYEEGESFNVKYTLNQAESRFNERKIDMLIQDLTALRSTGETEEAQTAIVDYRRIQRPSGRGTNLLADREAVFRMFEELEKPMFRLPGAIGKMLNDQLVRGGFVAFMGREKVGKTWWAVEMAMRAALARLNVAFFAIGDMSQEEMAYRQIQWLAGRSPREGDCGPGLTPVLDCKQNKNNRCHNRGRECRVAWGEDGYVPCSFCEGEHEKRFKGCHSYSRREAIEPLTAGEAAEFTDLFNKRLHGHDFRVSSHPSNTISARGIADTLNGWEYFDDFVVDVAVVDLPENLLPVQSRDQLRHEHNETWQVLRAISQVRHCLVLALTQADAGSYGKATLTMKNFSEDKRKFGHVSAMYAFNQTDEEKEAGLLGIGPIVVRTRGYKISHLVTVLQCLEMGRPLLGSFWGRAQMKKTEDKAAK